MEYWLPPWWSITFSDEIKLSYEDRMLAVDADVSSDLFERLRTGITLQDCTDTEQDLVRKLHDNAIVLDGTERDIYERQADIDRRRPPEYDYAARWLHEATRYSKQHLYYNRVADEPNVDPPESPSVSERFSLPSSSSLNVSLDTALGDRETTREYRPKPLDRQELGTVLERSFGWASNDHRAYPSGGGKYPTNVYLLSYRTEYPDGVYRYFVDDHELGQIRRTTLQDDVVGLYPKYESIVNNSAVVVVMTIDLARTWAEYGERGYRFALQESGHAMQNVYLVGSALGLGVCSLGGPVDHELHEFLELDDTELPIYSITVGMPAN